MRIRDRLGISPARQRQLTRAMQIGLIGLFFIGLERRSVGIVVNVALALVIMQLPAILERDYEIPMDAGLTLWITAAAFLHALGTVGVPGAEGSFYQNTIWWDHMTHMLSSSLVAAAGYATVRALDRHREDIYLPPKFMFVFILLFVFAFGVFWEVIEFTVTLLTEFAGSDNVITQYGLDDTMLDLLYNTLGGIIVALWGAAYLGDVVDVLQQRLEARGNR